MELIKFLQSFSTPFLDKFFILATMLGEESIYIVFLGILYWCRSKKLGYRFAFSFLLSAVINGAIKNIVKAPRPINVEGIKSLRVETATGYSFPSGHTQGASSFWTSVILNTRHKFLYFIGTISVLFVAVSRLYLGVHWPKDVLGAIIFGVICALAANSIFDYSEKQNNKSILLILIIPTLIGLIFFGNDADYVKASAVACAFYIGYILEDRFINFNEDCRLSIQAVKLLIGITGILFIKVFGKDLLPYNTFGDFTRYFMIGIWTTVCAPYIFKSFNLQTDIHALRNSKV